MHRRRLLKLGIASAAVLAVAGGSLALLAPGLVDNRLSGGGREVFHAAGRAILEGSLPFADPQRQLALGGLVDRIDALVAGLPSHAQAELSQLLAVLSSPPGRRALAGLATPWPAATNAETQAALQGMRYSTLALRQQAYHALHDIVSGAYFTDPATWPLLGYPGPQPI